MPAKKLERVETTDKRLLGMSTEELILNEEKDELFRRARNKYISKLDKS